jgi:hypothetical protein
MECSDGLLLEGGLMETTKGLTDGIVTGTGEAVYCIEMYTLRRDEQARVDDIE